MEHQRLSNERIVLSGAVNEENKSISVILSDESEVVRYSWNDGKYFITLLHGEENVDLSRKDILALFINHKTYELPVGIWENVRLEDKKLKADAKFDEDDIESMKIFKKLSKGFLKSFSVGIDINEKVLDKEIDGVKYYKATKWAIDECSVVGIPAIVNAKVGLEKELRVNSASAKIGNQKEGEFSMEYTKENFEALESKQAEALSSAVTAERSRVSDILSLNGDSAMKLKAIEDGLTAGETAIALNKANKDTFEKEKTNFENAADELQNIVVNTVVETKDPVQLQIEKEDKEYYEKRRGDK